MKRQVSSLTKQPYLNVIIVGDDVPSKIYVNNNGSYALPKKQETQQIIKTHIHEIKSGKKEMCRIIETSN